MESQLVVRNGVETLIKGTINRHGEAIFTKTHPLIADMGDDIYSGQVQMEAYTGSRNPPATREQRLRRLLDLVSRASPSFHPAILEMPLLSKQLSSLIAASTSLLGRQRRLSVKKRPVAVSSCTLVRPQEPTTTNGDSGGASMVLSIALRCIDAQSCKATIRQPKIPKLVWQCISLHGSRSAPAPSTTRNSQCSLKPHSTQPRNPRRGGLTDWR